MCGIAGFIGYNPNADSTIVNMISALAARGPDSRGTWVENDTHVSLGHTRLALVDLSENGAQPMHSQSDRYVVSYNGEIYNHLEMRADYKSARPDIEWKGTSDTETLLMGFDIDGIEDTLKKCIGMFSIAIWDKNERALSLVRDRFGEKPLYYQPMSDGVIFGSEISALEQHPACNRKVSDAAVLELAQRQCIAAPLSIYQGVYKLMPGTLIRFNISGFMDTVQWWSVVDSTLANVDTWSGSRAEAISELEHRLSKTISSQMVADVPMGAFLSGGIDSSLVSAIMQQNSSSSIKTFSIGFNHSEYDESEYAAKVAAHLGTEHSEFRVSDEDIYQLVPQLTSIYSEPFADSSQLPTYIVSKLSRQHVTAALTGDAGDEIFAGYNRHTFTHNHWNRMSRIPLPLRNLMVKSIKHMSVDILDKWARKLSVTSDWTRIGEKLKRTGHILSARNIEELYKLSTNLKDSEHLTGLIAKSSAIDSDTGPQQQLIESNSRLLSEAAGEVDQVRWMMMRDQTDYLPNDILAKVDRASMACSLETRVPFLDHTLVEFTQGLPANYLVSGPKGKMPLRTILEKHVPAELIDRPKMGFAIPVDDMLRGPLRDWVENLIGEDALKQGEFFDTNATRQLWTSHLSGGHNNIAALWPIVVFQSWLKERSTQ